MKAKVENVDIRGMEVKTNKQGQPYMVVRFEDEVGKPFELIDKGMERQQYYKRGVIMNLYIDIRNGRSRDGQSYTNVRIIDARQVGKE